MMLYITLYNSIYIYALYNSESYSKFPIFTFSKGNNYIKNVGRVMVLVLCLLTDDALYLYKIS